MLQARPYVVRTMTRTSAAPSAAFASFRTAVHDVEPDLPVLGPASLYDAIYADKRVLDALSVLFLAFGVGTVFLAAIGLFALLSFAVTSRTREFGVRVALGASPGDLIAQMLTRGAVETGWGLGIGLLLAAGVSRTLAATLEHAPEAGAGTYLAIALTIAVAAAAALWWPLSRVLRLSSLEALREE